jgi:hypothetical protein
LLCVLAGRWALGNCYAGEAGVSLSEEARTKNYEADNAEDDFAIKDCWLRQRLSLDR